MVPGAIGSQTNGSVIRPAAFCGVVGFKPTHGLIPRTGALMLSRTLDHVGVFARSVEDAALLAETMAGFDEEDPDTRPVARPPFAAVAASEPPLAAALRLRALAGLEACRAGDARGLRRAGRRARRAGERGRARREFRAAPSTCIARSWKSTWRTTSIATTSRAATSSASQLRQLIERGRERTGGRLYPRGRRRSAPLNEALDEVFDEYDAILTPAAPGRGAARAGEHRQSGLLHDLDLSRHAGRDVAAAAIGGGHAARRAARRPPRQRRAPLAHRALACQNTRSAEAAAVRRKAPTTAKPARRTRKGKSRHDRRP